MTIWWYWTQLPNFWVFGAQFIFHFVLLALNCAHLGAAVLAWLRLQVRSKRTQIHVLLFIPKDETTTHLLHNMQQTMRYSYVHNWKPAVTGRSNGQHWDQNIRWRHGTTFPVSRLVPCVSTHVQKAFRFDLWFFKKFKKCKHSIETNIFHVEKNSQEIRNGLNVKCSGCMILIVRVP